jgi:chromosome segregation ATPase
MFNIRANLPNHRYNLSAIAEEMGLGGQRRREEDKDESRSDAQRALANGSRPRQLPAEIDTLAAAQQLAMEQRKAAEALLQQARALEEQILTETNAAQAARQRAEELATLAGRAIEVEQEAQERAHSAAERHAATVAQRQKIDAVRAASQLAMDAANNELSELKQRLDELQHLADEAASLLRMHEQRVAEATATVIEAEQEAADAAARFAECQSVRQTAEREAKTAAEQADSFGKGAPNRALSSGGIDAVRALTARIAQQSTSLKLINSTTSQR